jgi:hypothetical protein
MGMVLLLLLLLRMMRLLIEHSAAGHLKRG